MSWQLFRWIWRVESPIHIGLSPAGMLNRTRLYIPAKSLWGALTAEIARHKSQESFPEYEEVGEELKEKVRLGYLYPAEKVNNQWFAWLPKYDDGGLKWHREDKTTEPVPDRLFRTRLLDTRFGTAINRSSNTAEDGTLREYEVINPYWRGENGEMPSRVFMVGYLFLYDDAPKEVLEIETIFIGGDTRYGLGKIKRIKCETAKSFFTHRVDYYQGRDPLITTSRILAHACINSENQVRGNYEFLLGWNMNSIETFSLVWMPGTIFSDIQKFSIQNDGLWKSVP